MKARFFALVFAVLMLLSACAKPADTASDWVPQNKYEGAMSDTGYYYRGKDSFLYYADFSSGLNVCLCSRVGCKHDDSTICEATIFTAMPSSPMFVWGDRLYYIEYDAYGTHVVSRNADGTGIRNTADLCTAYIEQKKDIYIMQFVLVDGVLYYCAEVRDLVEETPGSFVVQTDFYAVCKVDLSTGKDEVLFTDSEFTLTLWAARSGEVLCYAIATPENINAENFGELLKKVSRQLFTWSEKTQQRTVLFDKIYQDCSSVYGFMDGKFYYSYATEEHSCNIIALDVETREETLQGHISLRFINSRYALIYRDDDGQKWILYDIQAGTELPTAFEGQALRIINVSDKALILSRGQYAPGSTTSIASNIYCYVPLSALADGLQETDVVDFYIRENMTSY